MSVEVENVRRASFTEIANSTEGDWAIVMGAAIPFVRALPDRVLTHLKILDGDFGGFPIDRLAHSLQTATLAHRDGRDEEYVVCALLHDIGDTLGSYSHPDIPAAILRPFVSDQNLWMVQHHGIFQGYYFFHHLGMDRDMRDAFRDHPNFARTEEFCRLYDSPAFDSKKETLPLEFFEPMVRRVLSTPKKSIYAGLSKSEK